MTNAEHKIDGVLVHDGKMVGTTSSGGNQRGVSFTRAGWLLDGREIEVAKPKLVTSDGSGRWIAHEHVDKGDWLTDGEKVIGRAIEDCAFGAHIKEPVEKP